MAGFERALKKLVEDPRYRDAVAKDHSVLQKEFKLDTKEMLLLMQVWQAFRRPGRAPVLVPVSLLLLRQVKFRRARTAARMSWGRGEPDDREGALLAARYAGLRLPERPRLAPWLVPVDIGDGRLQLRSAESAHTLTHPLLAHVFRRIEPLLDGEHSLDAIVASVGEDAEPTTVVFLLQLLHGKGLLQPGPEASGLDDEQRARWRSQLRFLAHFVADAAGAHGVLAKARLGVVGSGELKAPIVSSLRAIGVDDLVELGEPGELRPSTLDGRGLDLLVACTDMPSFSFFDAVNRRCLETGLRWLRVAMWGTSAHLGPTVVPRQTACFTCLDLRLRTHQPQPDGQLAFRARVDSLDGGHDEGTLAPFRSSVSAQVAIEVTRMITAFAPAVTIGRFYELSAVSPLATGHDVLKVPRCPSCGRRSVMEAWDELLAPLDPA